ncbi:MAG TPA: DNA polymerase Y family protein [Steroidobacteraceae bacterium]|nr:DNA polymerase Y family protein [Steroidobacteraceae bacterium]
MSLHVLRATAGKADKAALPADAGGVQPRAAPLRITPRHAPGGRTGELWAGLHLPGITLEKLHKLAVCAQRFTPRVSLAPPDGLLLEVQGSLHLFAGAAGLRGALRSECRRLQVQPVLAFAPAALAALVAARAGKPLVVMDPAQLTGQLAPLPLASLRWPPETLARLARMGVRTIGAALRLPRAGFARRVGSEQLAMLDVLTGRTPEARVTFHAPERFRRRRELDCELENQQWLAAALSPLFAELGAFLAARQCAVVEFECRFQHRHVPATRCVVRLAAPASDVRRLAALLSEQLGSLALPEPVRSCELRVEAPVACQPDSHALWQPGEHGGSAGHEAAGLIERLRARLGEDAVHGLTLCAGHRPEKAWARTAPPAAGRRGAPGGGAVVAPAQCRPLWLLPVPQPLRMRAGLPRRRGALRLVSEPERIETGWWDGGEIARDYYTAVDIHGVRLWVFRERTAPHGWYLHGVFG